MSDLIGMPEAGRRLGYSGRSARRALINANVPLVRVTPGAFAVRVADLEEYRHRRERGEVARTGRPPGAKNKPKGETAAQATSKPAPKSSGQKYTPKQRQVAAASTGEK